MGKSSPGRWSRRRGGVMTKEDKSGGSCMVFTSCEGFFFLLVTNYVLMDLSDVDMGLLVLVFFLYYCFSSDM